jgi:polysaccharide biosynthesis protein PslH
MRILWVGNLLHPPTKGGQIRTLGMLRALRHRHEIHYVAFTPRAQPDAVRASEEYCSHVYPVIHRAPPRRSAAFARQLIASLVSSLPLAISRYESSAARNTIRQLLDTWPFDSIVCDFVFPAPNFPDLGQCVLFQHNLETMIWRRHAGNAPDPLRRWYFGLQAKRMLAAECLICRTVKGVVAVSDADADAMRDLFGIERPLVIATGVDLEYFSPPSASRRPSGLVFTGSMDWLANIDGVRYFVEKILPFIRTTRPDCTLTIVGRDPSPAIVELARRDSLIRVTGTVPDIRPYLWNAAVSVVPLRIGSGTRLKIYESMAAGVPVVSTTIGAEGLTIDPPRDIRIADDPERFARCCLELLTVSAERERLADAGRQMVTARFGWNRVALDFEAILKQHSRTRSLPGDQRDCA